MPRKKPHSAIPTVQSYDRKKKAKPVEPMSQTVIDVEPKSNGGDRKAKRR